MSVGRAGPTLTQLGSGKVLSAGGNNRDGGPVAPTPVSELFDPAGAAWSATGSLTLARVGHSATLLTAPGCGANCGKVLVAGGNAPAGVTAAAELYDPVAGTWSATAPMAQARTAHTATRLPDGRVLVAGGLSGAALSSAELFDPATATWTSAGAMADARADHTATLLGDGRVLVVAGRGAGLGEIADAELFHPAGNNWTAAGTLEVPRSFHSATLLGDGRVFVAGGRGGTPVDMRRSVEIYDPAPGASGWSVGPSMGLARSSHVAVRLGDGSVLVAGGGAPNRAELISSERYDPVSGMWRYRGNLGEARSSLGAVVLGGAGCAPRCGDVLAAGGTRQLTQFYAKSELYDPAAPTPPGRVSDLTATADSSSSIALAFSAPASILAFPPPAARYDIRQSSAPITTAAAFAAAAPLCGGVCRFGPASIGARLTLRVTGLAAGTTHHFALRALDDSNGVGALSNDAAATTISIARAVGDLSVAAVSARTARLTFSAPPAGGLTPAPATAYEIRQARSPIVNDASFSAARPLCGGTCRFTPGSIGATITLKVTGLTPRGTYRYALRARDRTGALGARSNAVTIRMPPDRIKPGRVKMLAPRLARGRVTLRFRAVASDGRHGPAVRLYVVRLAGRTIRTARAFGRARSLCRAPGCRYTPRRAGQVLTLKVKGLRPGRTYYAAVQARDGAGNHGRRSRSVRVRNRGAP